MNINSDTKMLGIIGDGVSHSLSPFMHNYIADALGAPYAYCAFDVKEQDFPAALEGVRRLGMAGVNVTMPHKLKAAQLCDVVEGNAVRMRSVNTVVNRSGTLFGYNTDGAGFVKSLETAGFEPHNSRCVILGAGGAAVGIAMTLAALGARRIEISNRTKSHAAELCSHINTHFPGTAFTECDVSKADALINTTSVGMHDDASSFYEFGKLKRSAVVGDVIYKTFDTTFINAAREAGFKAVNGVGMLIYQGVTAWRLFTGVDVPKKIEHELFTILERRRPIILTGFAASGKTTIGRTVAERLHAPFIDTDEYIERECSMSVRRIFEVHGEDFFRAAETCALRECVKIPDAVIAVGGGAVLLEENRRIMRKNGVVFNIDCDLNTILRRTRGDKTRPLFIGKSDADIERMMRERAKYYADCDFNARSADEIIKFYGEKAWK